MKVLKKRSISDLKSDNASSKDEVDLFHTKPIDSEDDDEDGNTSESDILLSDDEVGEVESEYETSEDEEGSVREEIDKLITLEGGDISKKQQLTIKQPELSKIYTDDADTSDEEDLRNTVGNIPMEWYDDFPHIGYDLDGKTIMKPIRNQDELDKFLNKMENPDFWKTIYDKSTAQDHVLTPEELELVNRLKSGKFYDGKMDPYEPYIDFFTNEKMIHPVNNIPEHKRSFIPSVLEKRKVGKLVHAIKMGILKPRKPKVPDEEVKFYDLWSDNKDDPKTHSELARQKMHIPAPKLTLPGHEHSYNPPPEYLPTKDEIEEWKQEEPEDRKLNFVPKKFNCLRKVPQYSNYVQERFSRCLDLYLCPRQRKMKVNIDPEDLIPKLPKPSDLRPFPTFQAICYRGHQAIVRSISVDHTGQWLASGDDNGIVRIWEVATARCVKEITGFIAESPIKCLSWCPNPSVSLLAVAVSKTVVMVNPSVGDRLIYQATDNFIQSLELPEMNTDKEGEEDMKQTKRSPVSPWTKVQSGVQYQDGHRLLIEHTKEVSKVAWHGKGDYFASTLPGNGNAQVLLHQLTKLRSQNPFSKCKGAVQCVLFHPSRPFLFVATQRYVRVYNLVKQELIKKLMTNAKWISSLAIHPEGDNLIVGSYDCRLSWFDMDLSTKPFHTLTYHKKAVRACCFHRKYPLFASGGDDGNVIVSHGMVYSDLMQNPLIVPVKVLKGHRVERNLGVLDCCFHPNQPWIFSSAADNTIRLFT
ncbi:ribosome biogenesis protein bop1-A-like [Clavelina lepadiformis]